MPTALHSTRVITPSGVIEATIVLADGKIQDVLPGRVEREGIPFESFGDKVIMPGVIDAHVHINEPGRTEWEGFETATKAAAAGGITTMIEMPLNASPVTTTVEALKLKLEAAKGKLHVNVGFYGGVIPDNIDDLDGLLSTGVFGIKAFLTHSGIDEFPNVTEADLRKALPILKNHDAKLLVHCELESPSTVTLSPSKRNPRSYAEYLASRPSNWETDAIALMVRLSEEFDVHVHIVHVSSAEALPLIRGAKKLGLRITAETCPHYLVFCAEEIPDGATEFKCAPPIRERANSELLWEALTDGTLDLVASDHSPAPPDIKEQQSGDFMKAWGGIAGLQFLLPAFWTGAMERGFSLADAARLLCTTPADFLGLTEKGRIKPGSDADLVIWDPEASFVVREETIKHRHKLTPYLGRSLDGVVVRTILGGRTLKKDGVPGSSILTKSTMPAELIDYIFSYQQSFFTREERLAQRHLHGEMKFGSIQDLIQEKMERRMERYATDDPEALQMVQMGFGQFKRMVASRIWTAHENELSINRCPKCGKAARTPQARQCRFCHNDWH